MSDAPLPALDHANAIAPDALFKMSQADIEAMPPAILIAAIEGLPDELKAQWDARDTRAASTSAQYQRGQARFESWLEETGQPVGYPASPRVVAAFVDAMGRDGARGDGQPYAPATIESYLHSINHAHRVRDLALPASANSVRQAVARMKRKAADAGRAAQKQAIPMQWGDVASALDAMGDDLLDLRDAALIALAFDTLARASELVAFKVLDIAPSGGGFAAFIAKSKTDQNGHGAWRYVSPFTYAHVTAWVAAAGLEPNDPLFIPLSTVADSVADNLSPRDVSRIYKRRVGKAYSAHSTRVGAAVDQLEAGQDVGQIMQAGGWKSSAMVARYTKASDAQRSGAAQLARMQGRG